VIDRTICFVLSKWEKKSLRTIRKKINSNKQQNRKKILTTDKERREEKKKHTQS
jgi:hypothetical protein